jgi:hypothetical protein
LTQQDRQRVDVHCDACESCRTERDQLFKLRQSIGKSNLSQYGEDEWREMMDDATVKTTRGIGWLLLIGGLLALSGLVAFEFVTSPTISWMERFFVITIYGGFAGLFISVLRQRLIERKTDKYNDVEI